MPTRIPSEKVMMRSPSTRLPADPRMNPGGIEARRRPSATSSSTTSRRSTTWERSRAAPLRLASSPFVSSVSGRGQPTDQPTGQPTTVAHTHPSRPLAKFSGLMDMGKYSAVIRWETRICVWAQSKYAGYEIFPANHTAVSSLVHQNTECGRTLVWATVVDLSPVSVVTAPCQTILCGRSQPLSFTLSFGEIPWFDEEG